MHAKAWRRSTLGSGDSKCKGPEAGPYLVCSRSYKEARGAKRE